MTQQLHEGEQLLLGVRAAQQACEQRLSGLQPRNIARSNAHAWQVSCQAGLCAAEQQHLAQLCAAVSFRLPAMPPAQIIQVSASLQP
jgi:hypothetical protein